MCMQVLWDKQSKNWWAVWHRQHQIIPKGWFVQVIKQEEVDEALLTFIPGVCVTLIQRKKTLFDFQLYVDAHAQQALEFERPLILAELLVDRLTG